MQFPYESRSPSKSDSMTTKEVISDTITYKTLWMIPFPTILTEVWLFWIIQQVRRKNLSHVAA